jgi:hypothetical protein
MQYAFRLRFEMEPCQVFASDQTKISLHDQRVTLSAETGKTFSDSKTLRLYGRGYQTEAEARNEADFWCDKFLVAGLRLARGFDMGTFARGGGFTKYGLELTSKALGSPVRNDIHGVDVFEDNSPKFVGVPVATLISTNSLSTLINALEASPLLTRMSGKLRIACELYGISRFSESPRVGFLTLISAVEALLEPQLLDASFVRAVESWIDALPESVRSDESFVGRARDLRRESISRSAYRLIASTLTERHAAQFKALYRTRSKLVHEGKVERTDFTTERSNAEQLVRELLLALVSTGSAPSNVSSSNSV